MCNPDGPDGFCDWCQYDVSCWSYHQCEAKPIVCTDCRIIKWLNYGEEDTEGRCPDCGQIMDLGYRDLD